MRRRRACQALSARRHRDNEFRVDEDAVARASLIVVNTPYAGIADDFGAFLIMNVPPGTYTMTVIGKKATPRTVEVQGAHVDLGAAGT